LTSSGVVERFQRIEPPHDEREWVVFKSETDTGFAVRLDGAGEYVSPLQRSLSFVRCAHAVVQGLGGHRAFPCSLSLDRSPPPSWSVWRMDGVAGSLLCAASSPTVRLPIQPVEKGRDPRVRVRVFGSVECGAELEAGTELISETIVVWMPEVGVRARGVCRGGAMSLEVEACEEVGEQQIPGVRLDLGEIEMRLSDLVGLRPGAVINLGDVALERCFIRLGATVLAEGRFRTSEGQVLLTIDSVL